MHLARLILAVASPSRLARFYTSTLGMTSWAEGDAVILGYDGHDSLLELRAATAGHVYRHRRSDRYWKIGITLPDVDMAYAKLRDAGITVSPPTQFGKIGYMCHFNDPEGFQIELLQHRFESNQHGTCGDPNQALGGGARIGQITLRVSDLEAALALYRDQLGMRLLSIQPVTDFGFTLFFLAFTGETPPHADLEAVDNREWLWQRPYTTLELQYYSEANTSFDLPKNGDAGFWGLALAGDGHESAPSRDEAGGTLSYLP